MDVAFRCEHCGKLLRAQGQADARFRCPGCGAMVEVPPALAAMPRPRLGPDVPAVSTASAKAAGDEAAGAAARLGTIERVMPFVLSLCFHLGLVTVTLFLGTILVEKKQAAGEIPLVPSVGFADGQGAPELVPRPKHEGPGPGLTDAPFGRRGLPLPTDSRKADLLSGGGGDGRPAKKGEQSNLIGVRGTSGRPDGSPDATGKGLIPGPGISDFLGIRTATVGDPNGGGGPRRWRLAQHVVFVVDRSGSMVDTFDAVRDALFRSIGLMDAKLQDFHVILFSEGPPLEPADRRLVPLAPEYIAAVTRFLMDTPPRGSTDPLPALARAFEVLDKVSGTKVIYLLTDSQFPDNQKVLQFLRQRNAKRDVCIHTLLYGQRSKEAEETMKAISKENGPGIFRHVQPD